MELHLKKILLIFPRASGYKILILSINNFPNAKRISAIEPR